MSNIVDYQFDVIVVGGGLAALRASIAASESGAKTAVVVKGMFGRSGSSAMTTGGFAAVIPGLTDGDTPSIHASDTLKAGAGIGDPELVRIVSDHAAEEVEYLQSVGGKFFREPDGSLYVEPSGEHSFARVLVPEHHIGTDFTVPMAAYAAEQGVKALEFMMCMEVVVEDGATQGVVCYDLKAEKLVRIAAPAVILCTGGGGNLFSFTSNPRDVTGDGYMLAYEAGAELRDMEFIQFYPWRCIEPFDRARVSVQPPTFVKGGKLFNSRGERFMEQYDPVRIDGTTRDLAARGIYDQIRKGLDIRGGVALDVSGMSEETFARYNPKMYKALKTKKLNVHDTAFIIAPEAHYFMGGVKIDAYGKSSVDGLYAAGETAGGVHGANRANSNALPEVLVIAARAGRHSAQYALRRSSSAGRLTGSKWDGASNVLSRAGEEPDFKAWLKSLQSVMDGSLGIIRNGGQITAGLKQVMRWSVELQEKLPSRPESARAWFELTALCRVGELCLSAALARQESRGAHYREDCAGQDEEWDGVAVVLYKTDNGPSVALKKNEQLNMSRR